jgi:hypothetical protein
VARAIPFFSGAVKIAGKPNVLSNSARSGHLDTMALKFRQACAEEGLPKRLVLHCGRQ